MKLGCVIMAAGSASRFGGNKLKEELDGRTLISRALDTAAGDLFCSVAVVAGDADILRQARERGYCPVENLRPELGISHTIRLGLGQLLDCDGVLFTVADQPMLRPQTVAAVVRQFLREPGGIVAAAHGGRRGNPCLFAREFFPELLALTGDRGGSAVIRCHEDRLTLVETAAEELLDCDTRQELEALRR